MRFALAAAVTGALCAGGSVAACAQVFQFSAGASTAFDAQGGTLVIHGANSETTLGAGLSEGRFAAGGTSLRKFGGGLLAVGQQQIRLDLPTDIFDAGHTLSGVGVGFRRTLAKGSSLDVFAGQTSLDGGTPLFRAEQTTGSAAAAQFHGTLNEACSVVSTSIVAATLAQLESVECTAHKGLTLAGTAGVGSGAPYLAGSGRFEGRALKLRAAYFAADPNFNRNPDQQQVIPDPVGANLAGSYRLSRGWTASGLHERFRTAPTQGLDSILPAQDSAIDELSLGYQRHGNGLSITALRSSFQREGESAASLPRASAGRNFGITIAAEKQIGPIQVMEAFFESRAASTLDPGVASWSGLLVTTLSARINAHLRLAETIDLNGGQVTFAHGGELLTERGIFRVDYQMFYSPIEPERPFQQAMVFSAELRVQRRLTVAAESNIDALGHTVYTFSLGSRLSRGLGPAPEDYRQPLSLYTVQGRVLTAAGEPMEGAALMIGTHRLYTDSAGWFQFREGRATVHPLRVLTEEFLSVGNFTVLAAPASVMSTAPRDGGREVRILVGKVQP